MKPANNQNDYARPITAALPTHQTLFTNHNNNHINNHNNNNGLPSAEACKQQQQQQPHQRPPAGFKPDDICLYYHIHDKKLGEGGFAKVRLATHLATLQKVAIKCLDKFKLGPELPRVYNEIECLKRLKHHNIARLFQVFETPSVIYLVLEYCAGGELFDYIVSKSKLEEPESAQIIYDLMKVLNFIHSNSFAHRDLKPENVLFDDRHQIKLIDFGLAANCTADNMASNSKQQPIDQLRTCCGSATYAAPEVMSGAIYSGTAIDVWSAGVMLYALLVGQLPFNDNNISRLCQKIQAGIKSLPAFLSEGAKDLIRKMLTVDPRQRITVNEVLAHPWLRHRSTGMSARINRRLDFATGASAGQQLDEQLVARCCEKFPHVGADQMRSLIRQDLNYYSATYYLLQSRCAPRSGPCVRRTPERPLAVKRLAGDNTAPGPGAAELATAGGLSPASLNRGPVAPYGQQIPENRALAAPERPQAPPVACKPAYVSPSKRSRFVTLSPGPRAPRTPPSYLRELQRLQLDARLARTGPAATATAAPTPTSLGALRAQQENATAGHLFGQSRTPKKSIVKRLLESATPSKLREPRQVMARQNDTMNITLTPFCDPDACLAHFQAALVRKGFSCKRKDFSLKCSNSSIRLTLEVCTFNRQCAIQRKRIKGDAWQYKLVCEEILRLSNAPAEPRNPHSLV